MNWRDKIVWFYLAFCGLSSSWVIHSHITQKEFGAINFRQEVLKERVLSQRKDHQHGHHHRHYHK